MVVTIEEFCKKFETVDPDAVVCLMISSNNYEIQTKCRKHYINLWSMESEKEIRFFIEGMESDTQGTIYNVERCEIEEDEVSIDYSLFDKDSIKTPLLFISVLKE